VTPPPHTFILVDDHDLIRTALGIILGSASWLEQVGDAAGGLPGLDLIRRLQPQLAIVDIRMPDMDGIALARAVLEAALPTTVVFHSAFFSPPVMEYAKAAGAAACIQKGSPPAEILQTLAAICSRSKGLAPAA